MSHIILMTNTTNSVVTLPPNENFTSSDGTNISTSSAISGATYNSTTIVTPYLSTSSPYTTSLPQQYNVTVLSESITENPHLQFYTTIYGVSLLALLFTTVVRCWLYVKVGDRIQIENIFVGFIGGFNKKNYQNRRGVA